MTKILVVTSGDDSISIEGIFSKKNVDLANKLKEAIPDSNNIFELELNKLRYKDDVNQKIIEGFKYYCIMMNGDGELTESIRIIHPTYYNISADRRTFDRDYSDPKMKFEDRVVIWYNEWELYCWALDEQEAEVIANNKRIELQKSGEWYKEEL